MGSTKENVSACESTGLGNKEKETSGKVSDNDLVGSVDLSVNVSSEVSITQLETSDLNSSKSEVTTPASTKKGKKKSRHSKKSHTPAKEPSDRNVVRRVHHAAAKFKQCRKRAQSFPTISKFFLPHKRPRNEVFIPPTKFLLGGNISDPLNLNSLKDENVNRAMNAVTPESSPLPTPPRHKAKIDVIIPPNIRDPLNLMEPLDNDEYEKRLERQQRRPRKKARLRRRTTDNMSPSRHTEEDIIKSDGIKEPPPPEPSTSASKSRKRSCSDSDNTSQKGKEAKKLRRMDSLDKIVSPVVPQPGAWMRARPQQRMSISERPVSPHRTKLKSQSEEEVILPKFHAKNTRYQFGNYDRYYGYRNLNAMMDIRLQVFEMHKHLFQNKDILDIGCNVGHISIAVARELGARSVLGIDIDPVLIGRARKNLRSFIPVPSEPKCEDDEKKLAIEAKKEIPERSECDTKCKEEPLAPCEGCTEKQEDAKDDSKKRRLKKPRKNRKAGNKEQGQCFFPMSMSMLFGSLGNPAAERAPPSFPNNVTFKVGNYVPREEGASCAGESPQFDLILCLSTTKWMHLNWGDAGLKRAFRNMFADLRPGGKLVLEAQNWASYRRKKRMTRTIYENFNSIELFPNKFREYLLSPEVGFSKCSVLGVPQHASKGFQRPIQLFVKGDFTPSKACWSDAHAPSSHHRPEAAEVRRTVYAPAPEQRAYLPSDDAPSCGAATPYSPNLDSCTDDSPFYNPRSDSYAPSYQPPRPTVYATLPSPQGSASPAAEPAEPAPHAHDHMRARGFPEPRHDD